MDTELTPRDRAYLDILHHGLVMLRESAAGGRTGLCVIEAEHLHEIPTLIGEPNSARHVYYLSGPRELYLHQLQASETTYFEQARIWFGRSWQSLQKIDASNPS